MTKKELYNAVIAWFEENMPVAETELNYSNAFELLVAVILSAQCTDKRINMITPRLFHDYPTAEAMASASPEVIFEYIRSVSYPNNKAKHLVGMARMLVEQFSGEVPNNVDDLQQLPGVGRKTANVILNVVYGEPTMPVDTHLLRISPRMGLSNGTTPEAVEQDLIRVIPAEYMQHAHHWLILHGRYICTARNPQCENCPIADLCMHNNLTSQE